MIRRYLRAVAVSLAMLVVKQRPNRCSFCKRSSRTAGALAAGPSAAFICSECAATCAHLIGESDRRRLREAQFPCTQVDWCHILRSAVNPYQAPSAATNELHSRLSRQPTFLILTTWVAYICVAGSSMAIALLELADLSQWWRERLLWAASGSMLVLSISSMCRMLTYAPRMLVSQLFMFAMGVVMLRMARASMQPASPGVVLLIWFEFLFGLHAAIATLAFAINSLHVRRRRAAKP